MVARSWCENRAMRGAVEGGFPKKISVTVVSVLVCMMGQGDDPLYPNRSALDSGRRLHHVEEVVSTIVSLHCLFDRPHDLFR